MASKIQLFCLAKLYSCFFSNISFHTTGFSRFLYAAPTLRQSWYMMVLNGCVFGFLRLSADRTCLLCAMGCSKIPTVIVITNFSYFQSSEQMFSQRKLCWWSSLIPAILYGCSNLFACSTAFLFTSILLHPDDRRLSLFFTNDCNRTKTVHLSFTTSCFATVLCKGFGSSIFRCLHIVHSYLISLSTILDRKHTLHSIIAARIRVILLPSSGRFASTTSF